MLVLLATTTDDWSGCNNFRSEAQNLWRMGRHAHPKGNSESVDKALGEPRKPLDSLSNMLGIIRPAVDLEDERLVTQAKNKLYGKGHQVYYDQKALYNGEAAVSEELLATPKEEQGYISKGASTPKEEQVGISKGASMPKDEQAGTPKGASLEGAVKEFKDLSLQPP